MPENDFLLKFKAFCEGYKGMVAYLGMASPEGTKYRILVSREKIEGNDQVVKINLCIYDRRYDRGFEKYFERDRLSNNLNYFSSNIIARKEHCEDIISHFIDDFYLNHEVILVSYGTLESWLTVHNTHFELCIKCDNEHDRMVAEARKDAINQRIRSDSAKKRIRIPEEQ